MVLITARLINTGPIDNRGTTVNLAHKFDGVQAIGGMIVSGPFIIPYGQQFFRCFSLHAVEKIVVGPTLLPTQPKIPVRASFLPGKCIAVFQCWH
jgi:hypothetical protein